MNNTMRKLCLYLFGGACIVSLFGCGAGSKEKEASVDGFDLLISHIEQHHDFIHADEAPGVIEIQHLINGTETGIHVIDLRTKAQYDTGHFPGAVNVPMDKLLDYFENGIHAAGFDTIALISEDGQAAFYALSLLRLLGYDNVYGVRFGMGWHADYSPMTWQSRISSDGEHALVTGPSPADNTYPWPTMLTSEEDAYQFLRHRVEELLKEGYDGVWISAGEVLDAPEDYFIVNYWPEHEYRVGHIPGARQYTPKKSLQRANRLGTLPPDQTVVVYCHQGNNSATVTAYLRLLGYDALSMAFGTNSFMYETHSRELTRGLFRPETLITIPLEGSGARTMQQQATPPVKEVQGEGGC